MPARPLSDGAPPLHCAPESAYPRLDHLSLIWSLPSHQLSLPARFHHAGDFPVQRQLPEAQPADSVLAQERPGPAAAPAAIAVAAREFRLLLLIVRKLVRIRLLA